jgi:hypothetical protein
LSGHALEVKRVEHFRKRRLAVLLLLASLAITTVLGVGV